MMLIIVPAQRREQLAIIGCFRRVGLQSLHERHDMRSRRYAGVRLALTQGVFSAGMQAYVYVLSHRGQE